MRFEQLAESDVDGMRQVDVSIYPTFEGQEKTVGKALCMVFGTYVQTPFKRVDLFNLVLQLAKGFFNATNIMLRRR